MGCGCLLAGFLKLWSVIFKNKSETNEIVPIIYPQHIVPPVNLTRNNYQNNGRQFFIKNWLNQTRATFLLSTNGTVEDSMVTSFYAQKINWRVIIYSIFLPGCSTDFHFWDSEMPALLFSFHGNGTFANNGCKCTNGCQYRSQQSSYYANR